MPLSAPAQRVKAALRAKGYAGDVLELGESTRSAADAARAVGADVARIVKSLVFRTDAGHAILVLTSGAHRVDEAALGARLGLHLERADPEFVRQQAGFAIGGVPPLGHPSPIRTFIDRDLMTHPTVWAAAGTPKALFEVSPQALTGMAGAEIVDVS